MTNDLDCNRSDIQICNRLVIPVMLYGTKAWIVGRDSSVGIATRYGLDGPGIESRWGRNFSQPFRPALGPTQLPVQWVPGLSQG
jgi:hypothetical protein